MTLSELKRDATNYTWELYYFSFDGGETQAAHYAKNKTRKVVSGSSKSITFEDGGELEWPKASQCSFDEYLYNNSDIIFSIEVDNRTDSPTMLSYHLRPIGE